MRSPTPVLRTRLELDRALRARGFIARAIRGRLGADEYADLIAQLASLVLAGAHDRAAELVDCAANDLVALSGGATAPLAARREACFAVTLFAGAAASRAQALASDSALDIVVAVVGTSWLRDSARRSDERWPHAASFLHAIAARSRAALVRLARLDRHAEERHGVYAFAELTRGALLGLATYLDLTWPAPIATLGTTFGSELR
jgi:hypothetical protein